MTTAVRSRPSHEVDRDRLRRPPASRTLDLAARVWSRPLWAHVAALVVLVAVAVPFMRLDGAAWVEEEGRLGLQVEALEGGDWSYGYSGEPFDTEGRWAPLRPDPGDSERLVPSAEQPAHAVVLTGVAAVAGTGMALYLVPLAGLVLAAVAAWLLGREFEPQGSRPAFWLVAGGPLLVNAYVLWAYTLVAAAAGFALLAGLRIARLGMSRRRALGLAAALGIGVLLAPEAAWFGVGLVGVLLGALGWQRRWADALAVGAGSLAGMAAAFGGGQLWVERITGSWPGLDSLWADAGGSGLVDRLESRAGAAWRFLFDGGNVAFDTERLVVVAIVAALGGGLFLRMRGREGRFLGATVAVGSALGVAVIHGARSADAPFLPVLGLLAAWPVVLFGLAALPWRETSLRERVMVAVAAASAVVVVVALPGGGSEREWGGRLLAPVVVPLGVVVAVGLARRLRQRSWEQQAAVVAGLVVLVAFPASRGLATVTEFRASSAAVSSDIEAVATDVVVIDNPRLIRTPVFSWRLDDDVDWYVSFGDVPGLLSALFEAGVDEVTVLPDPERDTLDIAPYPTAEAVTTPALEARGIPAFVLTNPGSAQAASGAAEGR